MLRAPALFPPRRSQTTRRGSIEASRVLVEFIVLNIVAWELTGIEKAGRGGGSLTS
nr:hypothetical protein [Candidatus Sigynarchaeota archaeon]